MQEEKKSPRFREDFQEIIIDVFLCCKKKVSDLWHAMEENPALGTLSEEASDPNVKSLEEL